jgi:hypothetical protein
MEYSTFVDYSFAHWLDSLQTGQPAKTLCLLGPPGIGKSSTAYALAKRMTDYVRKNPEIILDTLPDSFFGDEKAKDRDRPTRDETLGVLKSSKAIARLLDFSSMLPEDLNGLPFREGLFTRYCPQEWVAELVNLIGYGVMVLDDLPASANAMQTAGRQSALERRIHDHAFAPGILIIVTGNRREDKSSAKTLPAHFRNSVTLLTVEPNVDEWCKWYGNQPHHDGIVAAFLRWKPELLSELPGKASKLGAFATPRQWANLGRQFKVANATGTHVLFEIASGVVGDGNATTFCGFVEIHNQLVDPELVFDDPKGNLPKPGNMLNEASKLVAMSCALGEIAANRCKRGKGKVASEAPEKLLRSLAWATSENNEYCAMGVQTFLDAGGNLTHIARVAREKRSDKVIGVMLGHLKAALLGGS